MELTIDQAIQKGVAAHKEGKLQDAERFYRAILKSQPTHPDANHNLGVLAVTVNKADAALPLLKTALEANPKIVQFWLSYIDALIKTRKFDHARKVIEQAKGQGVDAEKLDSLAANIPLKTEDANTSIIKPPRELLDSLLGHYQNQRFSEAEKLSKEITQDFPKHQFAWKVLGAVLEATGRKSEAANANRTAVSLSPQDAEAHNNLGNTLKELGRLDEAEASYNQAIVLKPSYPEAYSNLGNTLRELGRLDEAEASNKRAIELKPDLAQFHYNLGVTFQEMGKFDEAEASYNQAIALQPGYAEAHCNLGVTLQELNRLKDAEVSLRKAIGLKTNYALAHGSLGTTLYKLGKLEEAELSFSKAIELKSDYANAYYYLGILLFINGNADSGLEMLHKAKNIDPTEKNIQLMLAVMQARKVRGVEKQSISKSNKKETLPANPVILHKKVNPELVTTLKDMNAKELDQTLDPRFGNGRCSPDYELFNEDRLIIKTFKNELIKLIKPIFKSEIYIQDSFFNIYGAGGGITPHNHLNSNDEDKYINLSKQKYSLVYYLCVGDQNCSEPGILKLYEPEEEVLPSEGMILIFPASRPHSAVYGGKTDRVMIGANFYIL